MFVPYVLEPRRCIQKVTAGAQAMTRTFSAALDAGYYTGIEVTEDIAPAAGRPRIMIIDEF